MHKDKVQDRETHDETEHMQANYCIPSRVIADRDAEMQSQGQSETGAVPNKQNTHAKVMIRDVMQSRKRKET